MLKIKDNVVLEKFAEKYKLDYYNGTNDYEFSPYPNNWININVETRNISIIKRDNMSLTTKIDDLIYDWIKEGYIEKVED